MQLCGLWYKRMEQTKETSPEKGKKQTEHKETRGRWASLGRELGPGFVGNEKD